MKIAKHKKWRKGFPYYKVQCWDSRMQAWHDIQKQFSTELEALSYGWLLGTKFRLMLITRTGREVVT